MARASRSVGTGKAAAEAAEKARADMARAAEEKLANMTFGEKIAQGLSAAADSIEKIGSHNAKDVAVALRACAQDDILEIAEPNGGTLDYLIGQVNETVAFHLRTSVISEIRKVREALDGGQGTDHTITYG